MWIAELSRQSDVPVATIKYYLREGLLPSGEAVGATRARYDESHIRRLRLIRALVEGGLSLARIRNVLCVLEEESREMHSLLGEAHSAMVPESTPAGDSSLELVNELIADRGWRVDPSSPDRALLAGALDALERVGHQLDPTLLEIYAAAAQLVGDADVAQLPTGDRAETVEATVLITALGGPVLLALRRLAQQNASAHRFRGVRDCP